MEGGDRMSFIDLLFKDLIYGDTKSKGLRGKLVVGRESFFNKCQRTEESKTKQALTKIKYPVELYKDIVEETLTPAQIKEKYNVTNKLICDIRHRYRTGKLKHILG